jgi:hypothetical protein
MKFPQGLKPLILLAVFGMTEVVPFQSPIISARLKSCPFKARFMQPVLETFAGGMGSIRHVIEGDCALFKGIPRTGSGGAGRCIGPHRRIASKVVLLI